MNQDNKYKLKRSDTSEFIENMVDTPEENREEQEKEESNLESD